MSDLFELPPSSPPKLVTLRAEFAAAQEALNQASANEDETGEPIPSRLHHQLRNAEHRLLVEEARVAQEAALAAAPKEEDPHESEDYQRFVAQVAETCHAPNSPCDSCLAGGICDGPDRTHDHHDHITDDDE